MKSTTTSKLLATSFAITLLATLNPQLSTGFAQGSLTPAGPPAPTMKTLAQIEPRTPISTLPFTITNSGSYYLTTNLTVSGGDAITIDANDVTLDLNGFTISSTASPASGTAVLINGFPRSNITIHNGHIRGTTTVSGSVFITGGFLRGVNATTTGIANVRVSDLNVMGVAGPGISLATSTGNPLVERCTVSVCAGEGIRAELVKDCLVGAAGATAITAATAVNCSGETVGTSGTPYGIAATTIVENCRGVAIAGIGLFGGNVSNSDGTSSTGIGLSASISATGCSGTSTSGPFGLQVTGTASFCRGKRDGGTAMSAGIAIGCTVNGTGTVTSANKFLGTP